MAVRPIAPDEAVEAKRESIPDAVIEAFNELIAERMRGRTARISLKDAKDAVEAAGVNPQEAVERGWFDVEDIYRKAGWKVTYDQPGYNETYEASYTFEKP